MNNKIHILLFIIIISIACKKEEIELYKSGHYIQFTQEDKDTSIISFFLYPNLNQIKIPLELKLIGIMPIRELSYRIKINKTETTASVEHYHLPQKMVFKPGQALDTAYILFNNKADLKTEKKKLTLEIIESEDIKPGQTNYIKRVFYISDIISKPNWWNDRIEFYGLGKYSDDKFRLFIEVTGIGELDKYDEYTQRNYMLQFKYYLIKKKNEGNPVIDSEGNDMLSTVPILG